MKKKWILTVLLLAALCACAPAAPAVETPTAEPALPTGPAATVETTEPLQPEPPTVEAALAGLDGLQIDAFFEESYRQLLRRDPELITSMGIAPELGLRNNRLTDLSDAYLKETQRLEKGVHALLQEYDRSALTPAQQVSYDVYDWYLQMQIEGHPFAYHNYPVSHFIYSYDQEIAFFFTDLFPLRSKQDAEDYIDCIAQVGTQIDQLISGLEIRQEMGIMPPVFILQMAEGNISNQIFYRGNPDNIPVERIAVYDRLAAALAEMPELSETERQALLDTAQNEIRASYIPGFLKLLEFVRTQKQAAANDAGVWKLPDGEAYYAYLLRRETTTSLTAAEIHEIGLAEVERIQVELGLLFDELEISAELSFPERMQRASSQGGYYPTASEAEIGTLVGEVQALLDAMDERISPYFENKPQTPLAVIPTGIGGYFMPASRDGSRPGGYYLTTGLNAVNKYTQPTVAYHEGIPGHYFQITLAQEMDLPLLRNEINFNGYAEGWALYSEYLAKEIGAYQDDPYGDFGRLQFELLRAVRLVADTGIHAKGWTREQAIAYVNETTGLPGGHDHEVDRYIVLPAQATSYKIGMLRILELRQQAADALGEKFDLKAFHSAVLNNGSVPLELLEKLIEDYITAENAS